MNKKLLAALVLSLAATIPTHAESALETALKDETQEQFIMPSNQTISANLPTTDGRFFEINDYENDDGSHYYNIFGNGKSGFKFDNFGNLAVTNVDTISGFVTNGDGGAFNLLNDSCLTVQSFYKDKMTTITGNTATGKGGAIYGSYNYGGAVYLINTNVVENTAGAEGGGLYLDYGTHYIAASPGATVNIKDNTAVINGENVNNDIYFKSVPNAYGLLKIVPFRDSSKGETTINIGDMRGQNGAEFRIVGDSDGTGTGTVNITNLMLMDKSSLAINNSDSVNVNIDTLKMSGASILNTANKYIEDNLNIGNITLDTSKNMFLLDADLREDTLGIDHFHNVSGSNLNLAINVIGADGNAPSSLTLFDGTVDSNLTINESSTIYGTDKYVFKQDPNNKGKLLVSKERSGDAITLQYALSTYDENEYELPTFTVLTADLGELVLVDDLDQPITRQFVIKGEDGFLTSNNYNGVVINGSQDLFGTKFTVKDASIIAGFLNEQADVEGQHASGSFISSKEADLDISNSTIYANSAHAQGTSAYAKGGAISAENLINDAQLHTTTITNSEFDSNTAISDQSNAYGGAIYSKFNNMTIQNSKFVNNTANARYQVQGGAIDFENPYPSELTGVKLTIKDTLFENNSAISQGTNSPAAGGALAIIGNEGQSVEVELENVTFRGNSVVTKSDDADNLEKYAVGGAIYNEDGRITLKNVTFTDNTATSSTSGATVYSDITNRGKNGNVTFSGGDTTLQGGITNRKGVIASGGHVIVADGANLTFADTAKLQQGSLIINNGTVTVNSTDTNNKLDRLSVANGSSLTLNSAMLVGTGDNAGATENNGTITNNSDAFVIGNAFSDGDRYFTNNGTINGEGEIELAYSTLDNNGTITNDITLTQSSSVLNSKYEDMTGNVTLNHNNATYNILSDSVTFDDANRIQGTKGKLYVGGNILSDVQLNYTGDVYLTNGAALTLGNGDAFQNASNLYIGTGEDDIVLASLNILNGNNDALDYGNKLHLGQYSELGVDMDWGDTLTVDSTYINTSATLNINKLDITNASGGENYVFASGAKDIVSLENIDLITAAGMANSVSYDNTTGTLTASRIPNLATLINTSATNDDEDAYYNYAMDANEAGNSASNIVGNLKVQGNGNSIQTTGITVGDTANGLTADVILKDTNISNVATMADGTGAITVEDNSRVTIQAEEHDVTLSGTSGANKNAIYMDTTTIASTVTLEANNGHTITIEDDIRSNNENNQVIFNNGTIKMNGVMDPLTAVNAGADVTRGGQDADIQWRLYGGTLTYLSDSYLNNTTNLNSIEFAGGNLNLMNGAATTIALNNLTVSNDSNIYVDVDLANSAMDKFNATTTTYTGGTLNVAGMTLLSDAKTDKTTINFTSDATLMGNVDYTGSTALSRIFKYNVGYDNTTGDFDFTRMASGSYKDYNPGVLAAPIAAQLGGYLTQLNSYDQAFMNMDTYMMMPKNVRTALKMRNKIASLQNAEYDDTKSMYDYTGAWVRPYATFENVHLHNGPRVSNVMYGSFFGGESPLYELGHGWDGMWGAYVGYNGSHQAYDGVGIYQNGGTLGLTGMAYKGNYFVGGTVNVGAAGAEASTAFGSDDFAMLMTGAALKTGYNWELANGKFIIQPNLMASYSFVNTFNSRSSSGVAIESDPLHAITIEPGVKFIGNLKNGWQPYAGVSVVFNIMDRTRFQANDVSLPNFSINPFVRYGVGVRKTWGERLTGHFQTYMTNGGRNGVGLSAGLRWAIGKDGSGDVKGQTPELKPTKITLNNQK